MERGSTILPAGSEGMKGVERGLGQSCPQFLSAEDIFTGSQVCRYTNQILTGDKS